ncbi:MAG: flagellar motor switch protein FliG [Candidatus Rokubacteria bacterium GWC2_70_24]|nr:MAG: flagellar motor switch protein FliG [Candidatus Rokubacteria bacterium GWC2_70_24]
MLSEVETLSGPRKAAIFLTSLGADVSARIFKSLSENEIETLSGEISRLSSVDETISSAVTREFLQMALTKQYITTGGLNYALEVLDKSVGRNRAVEIVARIQSTIEPARFGAIRKADPNHLASILRREHPQTVALVLANLEPEAGAAILSGLTEDMRSEVVLRVATMDKASPEVVRQIEQVLEKQVSTGLTSGVSYGGGTKTVAEMLNRLDPTAQKDLLARLDEGSPALAEQIRALMFTFEDLVNVDERGLQQLVQAVEQKDLVLSLKAASEEVVAKIFKSMSERTAGVIKQEIEFLGPVRLRDVEEAQRRVVGAARKLEESGEIILVGRGGGDQIVA